MAADQAVDLLQKLSLDSQTKTLEVSESTEKHSTIQNAPVDSGILANGLNKSFEQSIPPLHQDFRDPTMCYLPNGYDGSSNEWDYSRYANLDVVEMPVGAYGDNGSLMYHNRFGYAPYGTYHPPGSPVPTMGHDGQLYGLQNYHYPTTYYQTGGSTGGSFTANQVNTPQAGVSISTAADRVPWPVETAKANQSSVANVRSANGTNVSKPLRLNYQNSSLGPNSSFGRGGLTAGVTSSGYPEQRYNFDVIHSPNPWSIFSDGKSKHAPRPHGNKFLSGRNQNLHPFSHVMGLQHPRPMSGMSQAGFTDRIYPNNRMYGQYPNTFRTGTGFGLNGYDHRINGHGWLGVDRKYKPRDHGNVISGYGYKNVDGLNELNRGPRAKGFESQKDLEPITLAVKGQNILFRGNNNEDKSSVIPDRKQYNREDLPEAYSDAKFFIIKSYSEDDVHKSIKYEVWASTPNGNKKLDAAFQEAEAAARDCPVFLFFSVNASGQFVGLAEMVGAVDFNKSMEYWQQDKWTGCFPVKWHIMKDVPNSLLKCITLENNENKPVTNSRDTQEVNFEQGIEMLKIFKGYSSKTCILDDFGFYEGRQKIMQEKKAKQQQLNKQVGSKKPIDGVVTVDKGFQKSVGVSPVSIKNPGATTATASEVAKANGKLENKLTAAAEDGQEGSKPTGMTG